MFGVMIDIGDVIERVRQYDPQADFELIRRAHDFAAEAHKDQKRLSGDPYITHPLATAEALADLEMDAASIAAGLLHDVLEDTGFTIEDIRREFGEEIATLVDGVTKLKLADFDVEQGESDHETKHKRVEFRRSAANLRKIFLAMARDLRVMVIKLCDRLHNMETLSALPPERRIKVATETMQIFAPLAHRLGIWKLKWRLEDLAFKYLEPEKYEEIVERVSRTRTEREQELTIAVEAIRERLHSEGVRAHIEARPKHLYSIFQKMQRDEVDFSEIYDLSAIRVIVQSVADCYHVLGVVHDLWMPIPDRFDDYIAKPKSNMYQSLHTKVIGPRGEPIEVQIRTWDMHRTAEFGVAAHWQYKEGGQSADQFERKMQWLRQQLFDWQTDARDAGEFLRSVIDDLFTDQVFVFTPKGDVVDLPAGSTPVDFAYRVHSELGNHIVGAKVNGRIVPISSRLHNGDIVEVISRANSNPSRDWLNFVATANARNRIKSYFRRIHHNESVAQGRETLERELERAGIDAQAAMRPEALAPIAESLNLQGDEELLAAIGFGNVAVGTVVNRFRAQAKPAEAPGLVSRPHAEARLTVSLEGADRVMIRRARCCSPIPGDDVVGYVTRGRGMMLHRQNCPNALAYRETDPRRLVEVDWRELNGERYPAEIIIEALDRVGLLNDISAVFSETRTNIESANVRSMPDKTARLQLTVDVEGTEHLTKLIQHVGRLNDVLRIERVSPRARRTRASG